MILNGTETRTIYLRSIYLEQGSRLTQCVCVCRGLKTLPFDLFVNSVPYKIRLWAFFVVKIKRRFMIYRLKYIHVYVYVWLY